MSGSFAFAQFVLDTADRRVLAPTGPVEINGRYFDALALLVSNPGKLVSKDRFLGEVWSGVPVTDEALTQCIRTLRRELGDDASAPRFIETVPKHGYRFIAPVEVVERTARDAPSAAAGAPSSKFVAIGLAGTLGGGAAGVIGGLIYGFLGASQPAQAGVGAVSTMLVILAVTIIVGLMGAAGVSFAIAFALRARTSSWLIVAGGAGGLSVGAAVKLVGLDAFTLLIGRAPAGITGAMEGFLLGTSVGLGAWISFPRRSLRKAVAIAVSLGALSGIAVELLGGRLLLGSLALLEREFPASRLRIDQIGRLFGENDLGATTRIVSCALEGALFTSFVLVAMTYVQRQLAVERT
ncbi:MAG TPA: winged helix-turn-helix domain-containing protein [Sphingomicrobium sp.]|nr:winged helix-turn-helix domain-containing protein [Sphingomicrobium sp.]